MSGKKSLLAVGILAAWLVASAGLAQPPWGRGPVVSPKPRTLWKRIGVERAKALLGAGSFEARLRGVDRLAANGGNDAIEALVKGMRPGSALRVDPRTRLAAVRALAPHLSQHDRVRRMLVSVLNSVRAGAPEGPLERMARATAALGLARAGTEKDITPLLAAVVGRGHTGALAKAALIAFPPADLGPLGRNKKNMSPQVISLLGELGDPRVLGILRKQLRRKPARIQHAAAVALARHGDGTSMRLAKKWAKKKAQGANKSDREERVAGAEVLMWLDAPQAAAAIAQLLGHAGTRADGLRLAEASLLPALVPTLKAMVDAKVTKAERARSVAILVKIGNDATTPILLGLLARPELATVAAFGLARSGSATAASALARALAAADAGPPRRLIMRAAALRFVQRSERVPGLSEALSAALSSRAAADRAVAAFGLALVGERSVAELARAPQPEVVMAAARAALWLGPAALAAFGPRLVQAPEEPDAATVAASVALLEGADGIATTRLLAWAEGGTGLSPVAALQLARRDSEPFRERLVRLLDGTDPIVRLHVALGLAQSPEKHAVSLLTDAYRFEPDARVRRAIIRALSLRNEKRRESTLRRAAHFDPDAEVRGFAAAAQTGRRFALTVTPNGQQVAWIALRASGEEERSAVVSRPGMLVRDDGLALPVVSAPDGVILVAGLGDRHEVSVVMDVRDD